MFDLLPTIALICFLCIFLKVIPVKLFNFPKMDIPKFSFIPLLGYVWLILRMKRNNTSTFLSHMMQFATGVGHVFHKEGLFHFSSSFGIVDVVFLVSPESAEALLSRNDELSKPTVYSSTGNMIAGEGLFTARNIGAWRKHRRLIAPSFHNDVLEKYSSIIMDRTRILLENLKESCLKNEPVEMESILTPCIFNIILETAMGTHKLTDDEIEVSPVNVAQRVLEIAIERFTNPLTQTDVAFRLTFNYADLMRNVGMLRNLVQQRIIEKRRTLEELNQNDAPEKKAAFLDHLIQHQLHERSSFSDKELIDETMTMFIAALETTVIGLTWSLFLLGHNPDIQDKLRQEVSDVLNEDLELPITGKQLLEMKYLEAVIKETQRLFPSAPITGRQLKNDLIISGKHIPKGTDVLLLLPAIHRHPDHYPEAEKFLPERFLRQETGGLHPFAYIPFGAGRRNCIGQPLAMKEMKIILASIVKTFYVKSLEPRDKIHQEIGITGKPSKPIYLELKLLKH